MQTEDFLTSQTTPLMPRHGRHHDDEDDGDNTLRLPVYLSDTTTFQETQDGESSGVPTARRNKKPAGSFHRCKTAPALASIRELTRPTTPQSESDCTTILTFIFLFIYLSLGGAIYFFNRDHFSGNQTNHTVVDALYFCIVSMCTIGYGDIAPSKWEMKLFACVFVLLGFCFIQVLLSGAVKNLLDFLEKSISRRQRRLFPARICIADVRTKVAMAIGAVVFSIGSGTLGLYFLEEKLGLGNSVYLSIMSVTTVGYGDMAFKTARGRLFAAFWLLFSTLAVAHAFVCLAELRADKRKWGLAERVLQRDISVEDFLAADVNNNGFVRKSEYVIYKLKELEKIEEKDVLQICKQFSKFDSNNSGKITLPDLLENRS